jgi:Leucine-rich repeat (LRR) protein
VLSVKPKEMRIKISPFFYFLLLLSVTSAEVLDCNFQFALLSPESCRIGSGAVQPNEDFNISNADPAKVTGLFIMNVEFSTLPQNIFVNYPLVDVFYVAKNQLTKILIKDFKSANFLKQVSIYANLIELIPQQIFRFCPSLEKLSISLCPVGKIAKGAFSNLRKVKKLELSDLPLSSYPANLLANMTSLQEIIISNCSLTNLPKFFFRNNLNLTTVTLTYNAITTIFDGTFDHLEELDRLDLSNNSIDSVSTSSALQFNANFNQIQNLHISSRTTYISAVYNNIKNLTCDDALAVRILSLQKNEVNNFACIRKMSEAFMIMMGSNKISTLNQKLFNHLQNISTFGIQDNPIKTIAKMFTPMKKLKNLYVDRLTTGYKNLRLLYPDLSMLYLTTKSWNCSHLKLVANTLNTQKIYLRFLDEGDFPNFKCQLKIWEVSKFT